MLLLRVGVLVAVLGLFAGCGEAVQSGAQAPGGGVPASRAVPPSRDALPPTGCGPKIANPVAAQQALNNARPGELICLSGPALASAHLQVMRGGVPGAPVQLLSDGATVLGIDVRADQVVVAGFTVREGGGITLNGTGLRAHDNNVLNATMSGISCECTDTVIESNMVDGTDGTGIRVEGDRITVRDNEVSGSVRREASDADGMRFFGTAIRITGNTVRDISEKGYPPDEAPHTDCFQTYDSDAPPTYDVVISDNRCERVDVQCLIATGERGNPGVPNGVRSIIFRDNFCNVGGSQAVLLENYPHADVRGNTIMGPNLYRGVYISSGSKDTVVADNVLHGDKDVLESDEQSEPVAASNNRNQP